MTDIEPHTAAPLIDFPCEFPLKVMGLSTNEFPETVVMLIQSILPKFSSEKIETRSSSSGKYSSLTCMVYVESQVQLDDIYRLISAHPLVKFAL
jgi:putative lipoic acid-binding regulatory protein